VRIPEPFLIRDCSLVPIATGLVAQNLREFRDLLSRAPEGSIYTHFYESLLRFSFDDPEFRNDFALWAKHSLHDSVLAERLGVIDPHDFPTIEDLRKRLLDIIDDRIYEAGFIPWARTGDEFYFLLSQSQVFDTSIRVETPKDLALIFPDLSTGSIYYHFIEARRRLPNRKDDFTSWLAEFGDEYRDLCQRLGRVEYYFCSLSDLKGRLSRVFRDWRGFKRQNRRKKKNDPA